MENRVLRCHYCNAILIQSDLQKDGTCFCGSRKIRLAFAITPAEMEEIKARGFVPDEGQITTNRDEAWLDEEKPTSQISGVEVRGIVSEPETDHQEDVGE